MDGGGAGGATANAGMNTPFDAATSTCCACTAAGATRLVSYDPRLYCSTACQQVREASHETRDGAQEQRARGGG